jgi:hypothetical protein
MDVGRKGLGNGFGNNPIFYGTGGARFHKVSRNPIVISGDKDE